MANSRTSDLAAELSSRLSRVVGNWSCERAEIVPSGFSSIDRVGIDQVDDLYEAWVLLSNRRERVALSCSDDMQPVGDDLLLMRKIISVFNCVRPQDTYPSWSHSESC